MELCPYEVLGLPRGAEKTQVRKAYKTLALKYHPDRAQYPYQKEMFGERMCKINDAYALLMNNKKKGIYDRYGIIDDGQTEIVIDESEEILTKFNKELKDDGFYKDDAPKEPEEPISKGTWSERFGRHWRGTILDRTTCPTCKGKKLLQVQRGFFTVEEYCENCGGKGYVTHEIADPNNPTYNNHPYNNNPNSHYNQKNNWGNE